MSHGRVELRLVASGVVVEGGGGEGAGHASAEAGQDGQGGAQGLYRGRKRRKLIICN